MNSREYLIKSLKTALLLRYQPGAHVPWKGEPLPQKMPVKEPVKPAVIKAPLPPVAAIQAPPPLRSPSEPAKPRLLPKAKEKLPPITIDKKKESEKKDLAPLFHFYQTQFPNYPIIETLPAEFLSALEEKTFSADILLVSFNEQKDDLNLLNNIAQALRIRFSLSVSVEKTFSKNLARWLPSPLKLIIAPDYGIGSDPEISKHFKEDSALGKYKLDQTPLMLLPDLKMYRREPKLKSSLWRALCQEIQSLK